VHVGRGVSHAAAGSRDLDRSVSTRLHARDGQAATEARTNSLAVRSLLLGGLSLNIEVGVFESGHDVGCMR